MASSLHSRDSPKNSLRVQLERLTLHAAILTNWFASIIRSVPFNILPKEKRLHVAEPKTNWEIAATYFVGFLLTFHTTFQLFSFGSSIFVGKITAGLALHLFYAGFCTLSLLFYWTY